MPNLFQLWTWAGASPQPESNISAIRIVNLLALLFLSLLFCQIPFNLLFWDQGADVQIVIILLHSLGLLMIPLINLYLGLPLSRLLLCVLYASYLSHSSCYLGHNSDCHLLFLPAILISPFMFGHQDKLLSRLVSLTFCGLFLLFQFSLHQNHNISIGYVQFVWSGNQLSLVLTCMACASFISHSVTRSWQYLS